MEINKLTEIFNIYYGLDMGKYGEGFYKNDSKACWNGWNNNGPDQKIREVPESTVLVDFGGRKIKSLTL